MQMFEGRTHALLQEAGIDLVDICKEEGFYITQRTLSAPIKTRSKTSFGDAAAPVDLPTSIELDKVSEECAPVAPRVHERQCCELSISLMDAEAANANALPVMGGLSGMEQDSCLSSPHPETSLHMRIS